MSLSSHNTENQVEKRVQIESQSFHNSENAWAVLKVRDSSTDKLFTAVGYLGPMTPGEHYAFFGNWNIHEKFGQQFKVVRAVVIRPSTKATINKYLSSGLFKGIGEKTAQKIVEYFGVDTLDVLEKSPEKLKKVPNIGKKKLNGILSTWRQQKQFSENQLFLSNHGISLAMAARIIKKYKDETISKISLNPYILVRDIHGIGFIIADRIARSVGISKDHPQRLGEGILYILQKGAEKGHCYLSSEQLNVGFQEILGVDLHCQDDKIKTAMDELLSESYLHRLPSQEKNNVDHYYLMDLFIAEQMVIRSVLEILQTSYNSFDEDTENRVQSWLTRYFDRAQIQLSAQQKEGVLEAVRNKFFILTGGPGVGKTTVANTIIRLF